PTCSGRAAGASTSSAGAGDCRRASRGRAARACARGSRRCRSPGISGPCGCPRAGRGRRWGGSAEGAGARGRARRWAAAPTAVRPAPPPAPTPGVPETVDESYAEVLSTQEAFGRVLAALGRLPVGDSIVTVSADVAVTTHLAGWMNRRGIYHPDTRIDAFADVPQALKWREGPRGQHVELGIAEHDLFLLLAALGLTAEVSGQPLLPIGTLYDPFVTRGLAALYPALYTGAR